MSAPTAFSISITRTKPAPGGALSINASCVLGVFASSDEALGAAVRLTEEAARGTDGWAMCPPDVRPVSEAVIREIAALDASRDALLAAKDAGNARLTAELGEAREAIAKFDEVYGSLMRLSDLGMQREDAALADNARLRAANAELVMFLRRLHEEGLPTMPELFKARISAALHASFAEVAP